MSRLFKARMFDATAVASTGSATSAALDTRWITRIESLILTSTSTGNAADLKVAFKTAATADGTYTDPDDVATLTSSTATDFPASATDAIAISFPPTLGRFVKIVLTGVGSNPADTVVTGILVCREE